MPDLVVILNPQAGRGAAGRRRGELEQAFHAARLDAVVEPTEESGHAPELVRQALERGIRRLAVVGGDGTISAVAGALLRHPAGHAAALGIIPIGTGNDFVKSLAGYAANDLRGAVQRLAAGHTRQIDAGQVRLTTADGAQQTHYFINNLALGIDALVAAESERVPLLRGTAAYLGGALRALLAYRVRPIRLRFAENELHQGFLLATVANGRCQGGGFWLTPDALLDDGLLDLCLVEPLRPDQVVFYLPRALRGKHTGLSKVHMARAAAVEVVYSTPALVVTDGEVAARDVQRLAAQVLPRALRLIV
jgi:YegS/Rv2252/BmrU family lipid kinase